MSKIRLSLSVKILIALILGVGTALFLGERVAWLEVVGNIFIGLLQMTVLPYIMVSLIVSIGRLNKETGKRIARYGALFLVLLLGLGLVGLVLLPLAFPNWNTGSFYTPNLNQGTSDVNLVELYVPSNPFAALTQNVVPAVVVFSIFVGLGVSRVKGNEVLLKPLDVIIEGLEEVNRMVIKLTPYGVFAIAAGVVTHLSSQDLVRLQGYLIVYFVAVVLFTFVVLPIVINLFTPFSSRKVLRSLQSTLFTIFATGKIIVVFPQLIQDIKDLVVEQRGNHKEIDEKVDLIMPLAYPFPGLGTFLVFIFVPFAAWFSGNPLTVSDQPLFLSSTLLNAFVAPITGLPYSLNLMGISQDTFQLFIVSSLLTDRLRAVLGAFHLVTLTLLTISAMQGWLHFKFLSFAFVRGLLISLVIGFACVFGSRMLLNSSLAKIPTKAQRFNQFELVNKEQPFDVMLNPGPNVALQPNENVLARVKRTGVLRVGFYRESMPFAFVNSQDKFVGYGVDLAHGLAADLGVKILFVPIASESLPSLFENDIVDIVMSDIFLSNRRAQSLNLSDAYLDISLALLVKKEFEGLDSFEEATALNQFTMAYFRVSEIADDYISHFPKAKKIEIRRYQDFFDSTYVANNKIDAFMTSAERATDLTVLHPDYKVVNPLPYRMYSSLVFPLAYDQSWRNYINQWIGVRKRDGTFDKVYSQWILGIENKAEDKVWSVWDDVLWQE